MCETKNVIVKGLTVGLFEINPLECILQRSGHTRAGHQDPDVGEAGSIYPAVRGRHVRPPGPQAGLIF